MSKAKIAAPILDAAKAKVETIGSKAEQILAAAVEVFLEHGYANASMDTVAARASVSKATIYAHFSSKKALFEAIIQNRCQKFGAGKPPPGLDPVEALTELGRAIVTLMIAPEGLRMFRVIVGEAGRQAEMAEAFYTGGPANSLKNLSEVFALWDAEGKLSVPNPRHAADLFLTLLRSDFYLRRQLNLPRQPEEMTEEELVQRAVSVICTHYARRPKRNEPQP